MAFRGTALANRARLGAARVRLGNPRWFLGQRPAFALQSRRLWPSGRLAGCAWGGNLPCSRCLSGALGCSLAAAFTYSGGFLSPPGTLGSRFGHRPVLQRHAHADETDRPESSLGSSRSCRSPKAGSLDNSTRSARGRNVVTRILGAERLNLSLGTERRRSPGRHTSREIRVHVSG